MSLAWLVARAETIRLVPLAVVLDPSADGVLLGALCGLLALFFGWLGLRQRAGVARAVAVAT